MAFTHGTNATFWLANASGTLQNLSQYVTSVSLPISVDTDEVTTLGKVAKVYIPTLRDATLSVEGPSDPTVEAHMFSILGVSCAFEYYPTGPTGVKYSGTCFLTSFEPSSEVSAANKWSAEFQCSDVITRTST